jgi:hypothetical protein
VKSSAISPWYAYFLVSVYDGTHGLY